MNQPQTILKKLRDLVPQRPLTYHEAERIAELQANRLRELLQVSGPRLPEEAISQLPRIHVQVRRDLPVSGITYWDNGRWIIGLNAAEPRGRQRFSLAHEFKHVLDHTTKQWLYPSGFGMKSGRKIERLTDYFAGCLLMPKRHVKSLFGRRYRLQQMADAFEVSDQAMSVRLYQLGLSQLTRRCDSGAARIRTSFSRPTYERTTDIEVVAA